MLRSNTRSEVGALIHSCSQIRLATLFCFSTQAHVANSENKWTSVLSGNPGCRYGQAVGGHKHSL